MRFEIKGGGVAAIVVAVAILSGVVFVFGLMAGYDVGRQAQLDSAPIAASYPMPSPPSASSGPATQTATMRAPATPVVETPARPAASATLESAAAMVDQGGTNKPGTAPAPQRSASGPIANARPSNIANAPRDETAETEAAAADSRTARDVESDPLVRREAAARPHHRPYNIQIQAAMDIAGADEMMTRLQKLGYSSHLVPTEIDGRRWYKVEVGPYATREEATDAEAELREKYDVVYGGAASPPAAASDGAGDNSEE